jgi:proteasome accessory factor B
LGTASGGAATPLAALDVAPALPELFEALRRRSVATFTHRGAVRRLEPYGIAVRRGHWYVVGRDLDRDAIRAFRADRIDGEVSFGPSAAFARPEGFIAGDHIEDRAWMLGAGPGVTVRIRVDAPLVPEVLGDFGDDAEIEIRHPDGSVDLAVTVTAPGALRTHLVGYLEAVEVLGPEAERAAMTGMLRAIAGPR